MPETNERVSVLEVKVDNMEEALKGLNTAQREHREITLQIKEKIDKQNGALPYLAESVKIMSDRQEEMMQQMNQVAVTDAKTKVKMGILWSIAALVGTAIVGYALKGFLG